MKTIELTSNYILYGLIQGNGWFLVELHHVSRNEFGGSNQTPVGEITALKHPGNDASKPHWQIKVALRSDIYFKHGRIEVKKSIKDKKRKVDEILDSSILSKIVDKLKQMNLVEDPIAYYMSINRSIGFEAIGDLFSDD